MEEPVNMNINGKVRFAGAMAMGANQGAGGKNDKKGLNNPSLN